ncbi:Hypothetical protein XNRR2_2477 [Streptomyces albidoflavus]|uniref:hypothetical protein n=1 Tax=Streptomyces TaxID=1883 RepID=UPI0001AED4C6|nr:MULTISPECIES: hypothetical protein [Streptomyces]BDH51531.1 hypothetical protein MTP02_25420 [Streptomyces albus]AGI88849.1 Hypothetical protein XNR_2477 [Streptomyces albidoflavus]QLP92620.1 Hypothetical protein XNRR2_2477 [Streptomyces albidoflavus]WAE11061.1 Hypothetical protein SAD14_2477 [Streptomyces albidoflavus]WAE16702.1 Hypothetical protein SAD14N_2477 [Streptomyces albidoflavus]
MPLTTRPEPPVPPLCPDRTCHSDIHGRLWKDTTHLRDDPDAWRWYCPRCGRHWLPSRAELDRHRTPPST